MGAKTDDFLKFIDNKTEEFKSNFLDVNNIEDKTTISHVWVNGFGWERTVLLEEDFKYLEKLQGNNQYKNIAIGIQEDGFNFLILKLKQ